MFETNGKKKESRTEEPSADFNQLIASRQEATKTTSSDFTQPIASRNESRTEQTMGRL